MTYIIIVSLLLFILGTVVIYVATSKINEDNEFLLNIGQVLLLTAPFIIYADMLLEGLLKIIK